MNILSLFQIRNYESGKRNRRRAAQNRTPVQTMDVDSLTDGEEELSAYRIS
jgi:hypothetical protein